MGARDDDAMPLPGHVRHHVRLILFLGVRPLLEELGKLRSISRFADENVMDDDHKTVILPTCLRSAQGLVWNAGFAHGSPTGIGCAQPP